MSTLYLANRAMRDLQARPLCVSLLALVSASLWLVLSNSSIEPSSAVDFLASSLHSSISATQRCQQNPFSYPGYLSSSLVDNGDVEANRWIPFAPNCTTPPLFPSVRRRDPLPWLENRTIVLFGNSVDRNHLLFFCELTKGELEFIEPSHPLSPVDLPAEWREPGHTFIRNAQPHVCRVQHYGLQLVSVFHFGFASLGDEDHWAGFGRPQDTLSHFWTPPGPYEARLADLLLPLLANLEIKIDDIDVLEGGSYEWDLAYWQGVSRYRDKGAEAHLQDGWDVHLPFYLRRLQDAADVLLRTFPRRRSKILWRVPHVSGRDDPAARYAGGMEQATRFVFAESNATLSKAFELDETGSMLRGGGTSPWMDGHTHPAKLPNGAVWSDYILWQLRKSVTGEV